MASFFLRKHKSGTWRVMEQSYVAGKSVQKTVPKSSYTALGFRADMTVDEAKARVSQINAVNKLDRSKITAAARRVELDEVVASTFLPEPLVLAFNKRLDEQSFGSEIHQSKIRAHWKTVQKMIAELRIEPANYAVDNRRIYSYFVKKKHSLDYTLKLLRILNMWGSFICRHEGRHFERVAPPRGIEKTKIDETYQASDHFKGESDPLTPEILKAIQPALTIAGNFEWLAISHWFGLRPYEVDSLKRPTHCRIEYDHDLKVQVLWVYQSKLTAIEKEKRWKGIPAIFAEQKKLISAIQSGEFKRPGYKTMWSVFDFGHYTLYAGRKGFIDLMLDRGQRLEDISAWLGHQSVEMTWRRYRNKRRVAFTKVS